MGSSFDEASSMITSLPNDIDIPAGQIKTLTPPFIFCVVLRQFINPINNLICILLQFLFFHIFSYLNPFHQYIRRVKVVSTELLFADLLTGDDPDRRAFKFKGIPQGIFNKALIGKM